MTGSATFDKKKPPGDIPSKRYNAAGHAFCLMDNHYHLLLETPSANLPQIFLGNQVRSRDLPALRQIHEGIDLGTVVDLVKGALRETPAQTRNACIYLLLKVETCPHRAANPPVIRGPSDSRSEQARQ